MPVVPAEAARFLNNPANAPVLMGEMAKIAALRPQAIPFTPGQMPNLAAGKGEWAAINAKYAEGSPERAAGQMAILQQEYAAASDAGTRTVLAREIKKAGGTIPDAAAMATAKNTPVATSVVAPALQRPGDEAAKISTAAVSIPGAGGAAKSTDKPVEIPKDANWGKPQTVVKAAQPGGERAIVTFVPDGDGAMLRREKPGKFGSDINCRIDTIDAPETAKPNLVPPKPGQPFGEEAKQTLRKLIENKQVTLTVTREVDPADKSKANNYGRSLCQIEVEGVGVDKEMLKKGAAWLYREFVKDPKKSMELGTLEAQARISGTGLWADKNAEDPYQFRRRTRQ